MSESVLEVPGDEESAETYLLILSRPISARKVLWGKLATATIKIDPGLIKTGFQAVGFDGSSPRSGEFEFALGESGSLKRLGPFKLRPNQKTQVKLVTQSMTDAVKALSAQLYNPIHYEISVMQIRRQEGVSLDAGLKELFKRDLVIGGVTYSVSVPARPTAVRKGPVKPRPGTTPP